MFSARSKTQIIILAIFYLSSANALNLVKSEKLSFGKVLSMLLGVLRGSVVKYLIINPGILGLSRAGSSEVFRGSVLGQDTSESQPSTGETRERHE